MALPTRTEILELDVSWLGRPFCKVEAKALTTVELDVSWLGTPFVGAPYVATSTFKAAWANGSNVVIQRCL